MNSKLYHRADRVPVMIIYQPNVESPAIPPLGYEMYTVMKYGADKRMMAVYVSNVSHTLKVNNT
jgi:hypothetical protein